MTSQPPAPARFLWPALYLLLATAGLFAMFQTWAYDDAYITYRYAQNLHDGLGMVYNPGERILSTTTPLFALLLAGLRFIFSDTPRTANFIGAASMALGGLCLGAIFGHFRLPLARWAGLLLYPTAALIVITTGSEMPLFLALCLAASLAYLRGRFGWAGVLMALAVLARGDGLILAALIALDWLARAFRAEKNLRGVIRSIPWGGVLGFLGLLTLWVIPASIYFGSPLPATLMVKRAQGLLLGEESYTFGLVRLAKGLAAFPHYWVEAALALAGLARVGRRYRRGWFLLAWPLAHGAAYTLLGVTRYFWYYAPLMPGLLAGVGFALGGNAAQRKESAPHGGQPTPWVVGTVSPGMAGSLLAGLILIGLFAFQLNDLSRLRATPDTRYGAFRGVGEWLNAHVPPGATVATLEVGIMGYFASPVRVIDFTGLIRPQVTQVFAPGRTFEDAALWLAEAYHPEYFVLHDGLFPELEAGYIRVQCAAVKIVRGADDGFAQDLIIYQCETPG